MNWITFEERKEALIDDMKQTIATIIYHKGSPSKEFSEKILKPDDGFMFNIDGYPSGSYVIEVGADRLNSNFGHQYDYSSLGIDELCQLVDHLVDKYQFE
jgi:hypothetical protein